MTKVFDFYRILNTLKFTKRKGWEEKGMNSDSIASHSFGAESIGWYIAVSEKINPQKVVIMLLIHDFVMAKMEDVTPLSGKYGKKREMEEVAKTVIFNGLPKRMRKEYKALFDEFQAGTTKEAIIAREADKLETLFQGDVYEEQTGRNDILDGFFEPYEKFIKTHTGRKMYDDLKEKHEKSKK